ncbi:hypothetical protein KW786_02260 [Candidatus Parcubacteria bacterium]|nr:hypothetical protein [Candidatus Parcubacteria bacterium]
MTSSRNIRPSTKPCDNLAGLLFLDPYHIVKIIYCDKLNMAQVARAHGRQWVMTLAAEVRRAAKAQLESLQRSNKKEAYEARKIVGRVRRGVSDGLFTLRDLGVDDDRDLDQILEKHGVVLQR